MADGITLELQKRIDVDSKVYHIARLKGPFSINCAEGICILVFTADEGSEVLEILPLTNGKERNEPK